MSDLMSDLQKKYDAWKAKTSDKNYKGRNVTEAMAVSYQTLRVNNKALAKDPIWLAKWTEANKPRARPITTPNGEFESITEYQRIFNREFWNLHKALPHLYYYTEDGAGEVKTEKTSTTIYGSSARAGGDPGSIRIMFQMAKDAGCEHAVGKKSHDKWFQKMCKLDPENFYTQVEPKRDWHLKLNGEVK